MTRRDCAKGVLLGLACGDALGRLVEGWPAARIEKEYGTLEEFVSNGVHNKQPGTITDDTQLAMVLARSLLDCGTFDQSDFVERRALLIFDFLNRCFSLENLVRSLTIVVIHRLFKPLVNEDPETLRIVSEPERVNHEQFRFVLLVDKYDVDEDSSPFVHSYRTPYQAYN